MSRNSLLLFIATLFTAGQAIQASDISNYWVRKGHLFTQDSASAPTEAPFIPWEFQAAVYGDVSAITDVEGTSPSSLPLSFDSSSGVAYIAAIPMTTLDDLNSLFPAGVYNLQIDSDNDLFTPVQLTLGAPVFPTEVPHISNFDAAQTIDPTSDFSLSWDAFASPGGEDHVEVEISDSGETIFTASATDNGVTIPAGLLEADSSYDGVIRFVHQTSTDNSSYPGATGSTGFYNQTQFTLSTGEGGGGTDPGTTPPILIFSYPNDGATGVAANIPMALAFSEPMADAHAISWSANVNPAAITYFWSDDKTTWTCFNASGWPGNATITWQLNPTADDPNNFRSEGNIPLATATFQGSFSTGDAGPVDPCDSNSSLNAGMFNISKVVSYIQTGSGAPVPDPEEKPMVSLFYHAPTNYTASSVNVTGPGGVNKTLTNSFGFFTATEEFDSAAQMDEVYGSGAYTYTAATSEGVKSGDVTMGASADMPVPQILNLADFSSMDVNQDFTLQFNSFAGAGDGDGITLQINDDTGTVFFLSDPCHGRFLKNTDTSAVIPAGTLQTGKSYEGVIGFDRGFTLVTNTTASFTLSSVAAATTKFNFTPGAVTIPAPTWSNPTRNSDGTINLVLQGETGRTGIIYGSDDFSAWTPVSTNVLASGQLTVTINPADHAHHFYRATIQ
jgi:hypothetical protein